METGRVGANLDLYTGKDCPHRQQLCVQGAVFNYFGATFPIYWDEIKIPVESTEADFIALADPS